jgi:protease-4
MSTEFAMKQFLIIAAVAVAAFLVGIFTTVGVIRLPSLFAFCNVQRISLHGALTTYTPEGYDGSGAAYDTVSSETILSALESANADPNIQGIILDIDSPGGSTVAAEEIVNALQRLSIPSVALIHDEGLSAAYWASLGARKIVASENSSVGAIGVIISYLEQTQYDQKQGYAFREISSAPYKDLGSPDIPLSEKGKGILQSEVDAIHQNFVAAVSRYRALDTEKVSALADGAPILAREGLENGLIDSIGGVDEALNTLGTLGVTDPVPCN